MSRTNHSYFDGGLFSYLAWFILGVLMTLFSFGLAYPWAVTNIYRWQVNHQVIDGKRLTFTGTGWGLFGQWLKWWFLIIITLGIYGFWIHIKLLQWKTKHTQFKDEWYDF